ncbi:MAG: signal recognition particle protein [Vulcanibacillus sp.]
MAFEGLAGRLQVTFNKLRGKGIVSKEDVDQTMREVRLALLEADVNFKVVKDFIAKVTERAVGQEVLKSLTPGQQVIKVVNEELTELMGGTQSKLQISSKPPTIILLIGLQGAGKTTHTAKLAKYLLKQNKHPLLIAADIYRPAAIKQLQILGEQIDVPVFSMSTETSPVEIVKSGIQFAQKELRDVIIIDTAGRLHIDQELMDELIKIKEVARPTETLLIVDAMTGQDAVNVASIFNLKIGLTGLILTKLDGDTRGGAAISAKAVTGCPIKFVGMGEKIDLLEPFHPDRMASRILGMGDVLSFIEKAQSNIDIEKAKELENKIKKSTLTFDDYLYQLEQLRKMGPMDEILGMIPGANKAKGMKDLKIDDKQLIRTEAIIKSMTKNEKENPDIINASRRRRIADGSGTSIQDVNRLLKQFEDMKKMMKQFSDVSKKGKGKKGLPKFPFR